jgi:predicted ATPase
MPHVIVTGGPGAGKTALIAALAGMGYVTVEESARAIIAERLAGGASRRPDPVAFAREILRRDIEKYRGQPRTLSAPELHAALASYPFHASVFVLPPWEAIYTRDAERDQSFAEAVRVHARVVEWYRACGYVLEEVPRLPVPQRAAHVVRILAESASHL